MEHLQLAANSLMSINEAKDLLGDEYSCFELIKERQVLVLSPRYMNDVNKGILEVLKRHLGIYMEQFQGVPVAYTTVQREQDHAVIVSDQPHLHMSVQTEVIIFKPHPGKQLRAFINKLGRDYVGCLVHNYFNASVLEPDGVVVQQTQNWSNLQLNDSVVLSISEVYPQNKGLSLLCHLVSVESSGGMPEEVEERASQDMFSEFPTNSIERIDVWDNPLATSSQSFITDEETPSKKKKKKRKSIKEEPVEDDVGSAKKKKRKRKHSDTNDSGIADPGTDLSDSLTSTPCGNGLKKSKKRKLTSSSDFVNDSFDLNSSVNSSQEIKRKKHKKHKIKSE